MSAIALRRRRLLAPQERAAARERSVRRGVGIAWALLFWNTLTFTSGSVLPIPSHFGKAIAQGVLPIGSLLKRIASAGYTGTITLELDDLSSPGVLVPNP